MFEITDKIFHEISYLNPRIQSNLENRIFIDHINTITKQFITTNTSKYYKSKKWLLEEIIEDELHLYTIHNEMILIDMLKYVYNINTLKKFEKINKYSIIDNENNVYILTPENKDYINKYLLINYDVNSFLKKINKKTHI